MRSAITISHKILIILGLLVGTIHAFPLQASAGPWAFPGGEMRGQLPGDVDNDKKVTIDEVMAAINAFINPSSASVLPRDFDDDGQLSNDEVTLVTNSFLGIDNDRDSMADSWEEVHNLDTSKNEAAEDPDDDGYSNLEEFDNRTDPKTADIIEIPANFRVTASQVQVTASWDVLSGLTYNLYMASEAGVTKDNYSTKPDGQKFSSVAPPYVIPGLEAGKTYYFVVTAVKGTVESQESAERTATMFIRQLSGPPSDPANDHIPDIPIPRVTQGDLAVDDRPNGTGLRTSRTRIMLNFTDNATIGEVNGLLQNLNASIIGTIPSIKMVLIGIPDTGDFGGLDNALTFLKSQPNILFPTQDVVLGPDRIALPSVAIDPDVMDASGNSPAGQDPNPWQWNFPPSYGPVTANHPGVDGNWGLEAIRAPQVWNLYDCAARSSAPHPCTGVLDVGFNDVDGDGVNDHPSRNLPGLRTYIWDSATNSFQVGARRSSHGQHVAGIIGARFNNTAPFITTPSLIVPTGIQGVNPFVERDPIPNDHFIGVSDRGGPWSETLDDLENMLKEWQFDVVNISMGYNQGIPGPAEQTTAMNDGFRMRLIAAQHPDVLFVTAAGNDSLAVIQEVHAQWASPFNWATLGPDINLPIPAQFMGTNSIPQSANIIVVESVEAIPHEPAPGARPYRWQYQKSDFSNMGGHVSAPGSRILSTVGSNIRGCEDYETFDGTSMAAPHVTGLAGYILTLKDLTVGELRELLTGDDYTVTTRLRNREGAPPEGATELSPRIDAFAAVMGIDIVTNDPEKTMQRALVNVDDGTRDGNLRERILPDEKDPDDIHAGWTAVLDHRRGDGLINMRDLRAFRDAYLQAMIELDNVNREDVSLDGDETHFKRDLNFNGSIGDKWVNPRHPVDTPPGPKDDEFPFPPVYVTRENVYPRYDFNGDGRITINEFNPQAGDIVPFKIDPDTQFANFDRLGGHLRDIDVLADGNGNGVGIWGDDTVEGSLRLDTEEQVFVPPKDGDANQQDQWDIEEGASWNRTNLIADRNSDNIIDYLYSCDLHIDCAKVEYFDVMSGDFWKATVRDSPWIDVITVPALYGWGTTKRTVYIKFKFLDNATLVGFNDVDWFLMLKSLPRLGEDFELSISFEELEYRSSSRGMTTAIFPKEQMEVFSRESGEPFYTATAGSYEAARSAVENWADNNIRDEVSSKSLLKRWFGTFQLDLREVDVRYSIQCYEVSEGVWEAKLMDIYIEDR